MRPKTNLEGLRPARLWALAAAFTLLAGCMSAPTYEGMVAGDVVAPRQHTGSVDVVVTGGADAEHPDATSISNEAFAKALADSISQSKVFARVTQNGSGTDYRLTVMIAGLQRPLAGFTMTSRLEAGWTLQRVSDGKVVWQEVIVGIASKTVNDAFAGATRARIAMEGAAKKNITNGLEKISMLEL
jgi:hypothetical protein